MKRALFLLGSLAIIILFLTFWLVQPDLNQSAIQGEADLASLDLTVSSPQSLNGNWAFYWDQLIEPGDFADQSVNLTGYFPVPGFWTSYVDLNLPLNGRATYRLLVDLAADQGRLAISLPKIYTEYRLWINGRLQAFNGLAAGAEIHYLSPSVISFDRGQGKVEIVLQVQNQMHIYAGLGQSVRIGSESVMFKNRTLGLAGDLAVVAICFFAGFYHLFMFMYRKNRRAFAWFSLICLTVGLRGLLTNENFLQVLWPDLTFEPMSRIMSFLIPALVIAVLFYLRSLYAKDLPRWLFWPLNGICLGYMLLIFVLPLQSSILLFNYFMAMTVIVCLLMCYISFMSLVRRTPGAILFMLGTVCFIAGGLFESLHYFNAIDQGQYLTFGLTGFAVTQTLILALNYSQLDIDRQKLSQRLWVSDLTYLRAQIKPHFIYNALSTISSTISNNPSEAKSLLLDFSDYLRGSFNTESEDGLTPLSSELNTVRAYLSIQKARYRDRLKIEYDLHEDELLRIPILSIQPLVENAVHHGLASKIEGGTVRIRTWHENGETHIVVEDDGVGMDDPQFTALNPTGTGIGLANINKRLTMLYNTTLKIESSIGQGTRIEMILPAET